MNWKYEITGESIEKGGAGLDRGRWVSSIGMVELERMEMSYKAWVFLRGVRILVRDSGASNGLWASAEAAKAGVERVWNRENGKEQR